MYISHGVAGGSRCATIVRSAGGARAAKECCLLPPMIGSPCYRSGWPCHLAAIGDSLCWQIQSDYQLFTRGDFKRMAALTLF